MSTKKLSFFERLTGTIRMQDNEPVIIEQSPIDDLDQDIDENPYQSSLHRLNKISSSEPDFDDHTMMDDVETEAELAVDVFHNEREITIQKS
jgi:hypothetical protein